MAESKDVEREELERRLRSTGAAFVATRHAGLARIEPLTIAARDVAA